MKGSLTTKDEERRALQLKYDITAWFSDARFDRNTLENLQKSSKLRITNTYFLKKDIYQVIEGYLVE